MSVVVSIVLLLVLIVFVLVVLVGSVLVVLCFFLILVGDPKEKMCLWLSSLVVSWLSFLCRLSYVFPCPGW